MEARVTVHRTLTNGTDTLRYGTAYLASLISKRSVPSGKGTGIDFVMRGNRVDPADGMNNKVWLLKMNLVIAVLG